MERVLLPTRCTVFQEGLPRYAISGSDKPDARMLYLSYHDGMVGVAAAQRRSRHITGLLVLLQQAVETPRPIPLLQYLHLQHRTFPMCPSTEAMPWSGTQAPCTLCPHLQHYNSVRMSNDYGQGPPLPIVLNHVGALRS